MFSLEQVNIRRMIDEDILNVKNFVKQAFDDEGEFYENYYRIKSYIPLVVAEWQEKLIGVAAVYRNNLHPNLAEIMVAVDTNYRRKGLGRKLYDAALQARPLQKNDLGIKGCYYQGNDAAEAFLSAMGYHHSLDCHCLHLDISHIFIKCCYWTTKINTC